MGRPFHNSQEIEILTSRTKVIGSRSLAQILVEFGPRVGLRFGALGMDKILEKILQVGQGLELWSIRFWIECEQCFGTGAE